MTALKRLVLDTNLLVSGMLFGGSTSRQVIVKANNSGLLLASEATLVELLQVFQRPKFDRAVHLELREALVREYAQRCQIVAIHSCIQACRDARDNKFLELAVDGQADLILTGDRDLLVLNPFRGIPIITPRNISPKTNKPTRVAMVFFGKVVAPADHSKCKLERS